VRAWSWPGFVFRWLLSPLATPNRDHRCEARWCGLMVYGPAHRFCSFHHDALAERLLVGGVRVRRLGDLSPRMQRRLRAWADRECQSPVVSLMREDYREAAFESRGGIVSEGA